MFKFWLPFSYLFIIVSCVLCQSIVRCDDDNDDINDVFTAMATLEQLLPTEGAFVTSLQSYIFSEEKKLKQLKHYMEHFRVQNEIASRNKLKYFENPINAFGIIKRLSIDWQQIVQIISSSASLEVFQLLSTQDLKYPTQDDFVGAADALSRLQDTYKLDASSLARGELNGVKYSSEMSSNDCYLLGIHTYFLQEYNQSIEWLQEALIRLESEASVANTSGGKAAILEYLSYNNYHVGDLQKAIDYNDRLMKIDPRHPTAWKSKKHYQNVTAFHEFQSMMAYSNHAKPVFYKGYKELCRGEVIIDEKHRSQLKCYYHNHKFEGNTFLLIAPFKVEEAYRSPLILIFYDVLSDDEIETIQQLAEPNLARATVVHSNNTFKPVSYRVGKSAWLYDDYYYPQVHPINKRIEDMTGLTMTSSEPLQVLNYGIGGHYESHYDHKNRDTDTYQKDRIATVLFYMNDVEQGGATVFPKLGVSLSPKKGSAALWYNLHSDLTGDLRTVHAACPVLVGYKWVANKWIHDSDQIFRKPCHLKPSS